MAGFSGHWAFAFGLLGNVVSFMVFLAPVPTFYQIYKKKSTEGFQSVPYVVGLFSAMLWIYYAFLKPNTTLLITINSVGVVIETIYIVLFLVYGTKKARMQTTKLIVLLIVCGYGFIILSTQFLVKPAHRFNVVGWICLIFSLCVFVAPLGIMRKVIKTKSVEYMPFLLSLFLTLSAVMWFFYGLLLHDYYIGVPNILGFTFGVIQMVLYGIYRNATPIKEEKIPGELPKQVVILEENKIPELNDQIIDIAKINAMLRAEKIPVVVSTNCNNHGLEMPQNLPQECKA